MQSLGSAEVGQPCGSLRIIHSKKRLLSYQFKRRFCHADALSHSHGESLLHRSDGDVLRFRHFLIGAGLIQSFLERIK